MTKEELLNRASGSSPASELLKGDAGQDWTRTGTAAQTRTTSGCLQSAAADIIKDAFFVLFCFVFGAPQRNVIIQTERETTRGQAQCKWIPFN